MRRNCLTKDNVKIIIPQNTNITGWEIYSRLLGIQKEKIFLENIPRGGHLGDVDTIRNLTDIANKGMLVPGDNLILFAISVGSSFNAFYIKV